MKIAISNIAWQINEEITIAEVMQELGIKGVEVAPTKIWDSPLSVEDAEIKDYRQFWESRGVQIVAMQSLLFGKPELTIFADSEKRQQTFAYLSGMIQLGSKLGAKVLVFGSPKNRRVEKLDAKQTEDIALPFFYELGQVAVAHDVVFCIEPNPTTYGCNFITTSKQAVDLVNKVGSEGFGLHLDAASMTLSDEKVEVALNSAIKKLCHFHISEPYLAPIGAGAVEHSKFAQTLKRLKYSGWKSVEMKAPQDVNIPSVTKALKTAIKYYG